MKILGIIYLTISIITFLYLILMGVSTKQKFIKANPEIHFEKKSLTERILAFLKVFVVCFCPILNFIFLITWVLLSEQIEENMTDKFYEMTE